MQHQDKLFRVRIGIDLGGTKIAAIALDDSTELVRLRIDTPRGDYGATLEAIRLLVTGIERTTGQRGSVGIGIPGTVSRQTGLVKNANSVWLIGRPLQSDLEARLERPVRIANDANCFVVSEATDGAAADADVVFGVIVGTGTGGGIAVRGGQVIGEHGIAGEWGHNPLPWMRDDERPGPSCYCGRSGCIETFLSGPGLARDYQQHTGRVLTAEQIAARAGGSTTQDPPDQSGGSRGQDLPYEPEADQALARYEDRMARALASIINVLDPQVIVLGGGLSNIARLYANVPRLWGAHVFAAGASDEAIRTRLVPAKHGDASGVRGAAWLWN
jgi:fructokinase